VRALARLISGTTTAWRLRIAVVAMALGLAYTTALRSAGLPQRSRTRAC
jgi:hypothetical protein